MNRHDTEWYDFGDPRNLLKAIEGEPENPNEEFRFGDFTAGVVFGQSDRSAGFGLLFAWDGAEPEPGLQIVVGPLSIWWRRHFPLTVSVLHHILYPGGHRA